MKKIVSIPNIFLYIAVFCILQICINQQKVIFKTLDYLPAVPLFMVDFAQDQSRSFYFPRSLQSLRYYKSLYRLFPHEPSAISSLAFCFYYLGDYQRAADYYQKAIKFEDNNFGLHHNLGMANFRAGNYEDALEAFEVAVANPPSQKMISRKVIDPYLEMNGTDYRESKIAALKKGYAKSLEMIEWSRLKMDDGKLSVDMNSEAQDGQLYFLIPALSKADL